MPQPLHEPLDGTREADAHGQAALLLVESLIHALAESSVITLNEAVAVMEVALDTHATAIRDAPAPSATMHKVATLLAAIVRSLSIELLCEADAEGSSAPWTRRPLRLVRPGPRGEA